MIHYANISLFIGWNDVQPFQKHKLAITLESFGKLLGLDFGGVGIYYLSPGKTAWVYHWYPIHPHPSIPGFLFSRFFRG